MELLAEPFEEILALVVNLHPLNQNRVHDFDGTAIRLHVYTFYYSPVQDIPVVLVR